MISGRPTPVDWHACQFHSNEFESFPNWVAKRMCVYIYIYASNTHNCMMMHVHVRSRAHIHARASAVEDLEKHFRGSHKPRKVLEKQSKTSKRTLGAVTNLEKHIRKLVVVDEKLRARASWKRKKVTEHVVRLGVDVVRKPL
jgi:uncharacterized MAPEG superfamily protein